MKVNKAAFDETLGKLLKAPPLPLSEIPRTRPATKRRKPAKTRKAR